MERCYCTQPVGCHHNPICSLHGIVGEGNIIRPETRSPKALPFLERLRQVNAARCREWMEGGGDDPLFQAVEFGGEAGEVLNEVKKLVREQRGLRGSRSSTAKLAQEIGDCIVTLDSIARTYGICLEAAATEKFNATSEAQGFDHKL